MRKKDLVVQSPFHTIVKQLTISINVELGKGFHKNRQFSGFSSFGGIFLIDIDDFGCDFHKISLSGVVDPSLNITNAMVI